MSRTPKRLRPAQGYFGEGAELSDGPPRDNPPLYRAGQATPDRSQEPPIGPAGGNTRAWLVEGEAPPTRGHGSPLQRRESLRCRGRHARQQRVHADDDDGVRRR